MGEDEGSSSRGIKPVDGLFQIEKCGVVEPFKREVDHSLAVLGMPVSLNDDGAVHAVVRRARGDLQSSGRLSRWGESEGGSDHAHYQDRANCLHEASLGRAIASV